MGEHCYRCGKAVDVENVLTVSQEDGLNFALCEPCEGELQVWFDQYPAIVELRAENDEGYELIEAYGRELRETRPAHVMDGPAGIYIDAFDGELAAAGQGTRQKGSLLSLAQKMVREAREFMDSHSCAIRKCRMPQELEEADEDD